MRATDTIARLRTVLIIVVAISFTIVAGGYAVGGFSCTAVNPAVAIRIKHYELGWGVCYAMFEFVGAVLAAQFYCLMRPEEIRGGIICEFVGAFMLVPTVGLYIIAVSSAAAVPPHNAPFPPRHPRPSATRGLLLRSCSSCPVPAAELLTNPSPVRLA